METAIMINNNNNNNNMCVCVLYVGPSHFDSQLRSVQNFSW